MSSERGSKFLLQTCVLCICANVMIFTHPLPKNDVAHEVWMCVLHHGPDQNESKFTKKSFTKTGIQRNPSLFYETHGENHSTLVTVKYLYQMLECQIADPVNYVDNKKFESQKGV
jgi:hypothetical protein